MGYDNNNRDRDRDRDRDKGAAGTGFHTAKRFPERGGPDWVGPIVDYKEIDLLRKFLTSSSKMMSRKRGGANAQEQKALKLAVKRARFLALIPYRGQ
jgi:small subunit ribosomal protein S18